MSTKSAISFPSFARVPLILSFSAVAVLIALSTLYYALSQPTIPLFYSLARPEQSLVSHEWIFLLPGIGLIIAGLHMLLLSIFHDVSISLRKIFAWLTVTIEVLIVALLLRIVLITL